MIHHREWDTMFFFYEKRQKSVNAQYQASFRPLRFIIYIAVGHLTWRHLSNVRLAYQSIHLVSLCHNIIKRRVASVPNNMSYFNQRRLFWFVPVECFQQTFTAVSVIFLRLPMTSVIGCKIVTIYSIFLTLRDRNWCQCISWYHKSMNLMKRCHIKKYIETGLYGFTRKQLWAYRNNQIKYNQKDYDHINNSHQENAFETVWKSRQSCLRLNVWKPPWYFSVVWTLTHWGRVTHICVGNLSTIVSDYGLSPGRRQAIIWINAGILLTLMDKLQWNFNRNSNLFI